MDFFEHQDKARKKTWQLVLLFMAGILATLIAVNLISFLLYWLIYQPETITHSVNAEQLPSIFQTLLNGQDVELSQRQRGFLAAWQSWWGSNLNWQVSVGVICAVLIGTAFRYLELAGGGRRVAEWAGAVPVDMATKNSDVRQYINVCEEMAIAAGMPVPELFIMEREQGINAFVAGYEPEEAVLVVTKGALEKLDRDQLQGVIGHEYSHILNGDMRLNVRLMAMLAGLVMIGQIGRFLLETSFGSGRRRYGSKDGARIGIFLFAFGAVLAAVGYIGVLVGRMIKAAVSRQREFLADASSVQFTRNPDGLAGALYAIQQHTEGSQLLHRHAEDMSHFCFGETVALSDRLATHPPLNERIRRVSPNFVARARAKHRQEETAEQSVARTAPAAFETAMTVAGMTAMFGQVTPDHVQYAQQLYRHIPEQLKNWVHQSQGAKAFLYSQILLGSGGQQQALLDLIKKEDSAVIETLRKMWPFCQQIDDQLRLPVIELLIPTIKRLPEADRVILIDRLDRLVALDGRVDFIEWVTITLVKLRLTPKKNVNRKKLVNDVQKFKGALNTLFMVFVHLNPSRSVAEKAYLDVCSSMNLPPSQVVSLEQVGFERLDQSLRLLDSISYMWRKVILQSCADIVQSNGKIAFAEYEALRIVAECLDSPLPLLRIPLEERDERDDPIPFE